MHWWTWYQRLRGMRNWRQRYAEVYRVACLAGLPLFSRELDRALLRRSPLLWRSRLVHASWCAIVSAPLVVAMAWFSVEGQLPEPGLDLPPVVPLDAQTACLAMLVTLAWVWAVTRYPRPPASGVRRLESFGLHLLALLAATVPVLVFSCTLSVRIAHVLPASQVEGALAFHAAHGFWMCRPEPEVPDEVRPPLAMILAELQSTTSFETVKCGASDLPDLADPIAAALHCDIHSNNNCLDIHPRDRADGPLARYWLWLGLIRTQQVRWQASLTQELLPYDTSLLRWAHFATLLTLAVALTQAHGWAGGRHGASFAQVLARPSLRVRPRFPNSPHRPGRLDGWLLRHQPGAWAISLHQFAQGQALACAVMMACLLGMPSAAGSTRDFYLNLGVLMLSNLQACFMMCLDLARLSRSTRIGGSSWWLYGEDGHHWKLFTRCGVVIGAVWPAVTTSAAVLLNSALGRPFFNADRDVGQLLVFSGVSGVVAVAYAVNCRLTVVMEGRLAGWGMVFACLCFSGLTFGSSFSTLLEPLYDPEITDRFRTGAFAGAFMAVLMLHLISAQYLSWQLARCPGRVPEPLKWMAWCLVAATPALLTLYLFLVGGLLYWKIREGYLLVDVRYFAAGSCAAMVVLSYVLLGPACGPAWRVLLRARAEPAP